MQNLRLNIITPESTERLEKILTTSTISEVKKQHSQFSNFGVTRFVHPDHIKFKERYMTNSASKDYPLWRDAVTLYDVPKIREYGLDCISPQLLLMGKCIDKEFSGEAPSIYVNPNSDLRLIEYILQTNFKTQGRMFSGFLRRRKEFNLRLRFAQSLIERLSKCRVPFFALEGDRFKRGYRVLCENEINGSGYFSYADNRRDRKLVPT